MPSVFFYISGHGFGHSSRQIEIINALGARAGGAVEIVARTSAAEWLYRRTVRVPFTFSPQQVDTGVVQIDSLHPDEAATIEQAAAFHSSLDERARADAELLRDADARLVIADAPALGCAAARAAGVPSIVCSNFTWDWIYEEYEEALRAAPDLVGIIQDAYRSAAAGWRLPMYGGFETIAPTRDVPFVAHHARFPREHVLREMGLPSSLPLVLAWFGLYGLNHFDPTRLDCRDRYAIAITGRGRSPSSTPEGVYYVDEDRLYETGLHFEDLVAAVDVVATKPGYGIISECVANGTAMLYTARGRFAEYDVLVREMPRYVRCRFIGHDALLAGRWGAALDDLLAAPPPPERPATNGAEVVADMIARHLS